MMLGVTEKDKATKAAKTIKTIRTYVANSSRDYNKERDERREEGSEHEQDNLHGQDVDIGEGNNRQVDDIERIILDMLPEQEERNIEKERRENEKKEMERRDKEVKKKFRVLYLANKMLDASTKQPSTNLPLTTSTSSPSDNDNYLKEFRQIVKSEYTESSDPTDEEVNNFISREVILKRILSRYVSAIDFTKLSETSLDKLIEFSRKCFKIAWIETESANIKEKVKELDVITEDLEIPSCSRRNIASSLKLHLFS
ncbi:hypothetical protein GLOIN_2v1488591 [Rhizophagus clarus]|uniref:Uncharacterized protein n=2 Tax=Rhizophagus clarus TaxID=94130 RepID=A0A8H3R4S2_9GLOM|nr:hypothetical protein GLOIN_2v1488591 [Rhizophagus clarus]